MNPPKIPKPATPAPPPTVDDARQQSERSDMLRGRKGRAATFVSTEQGRSEGGAGVKMLLGQGG